MSTTLKDLAVGERGRVAGYSEGGRAYRKKLLAMGLTPGIELSVVRVAPMGDPVEVRVRGTSVSLRKGEAEALHVERLT
jgi:ferrous iron transport protein A